jgi:hypothetical protein
MVATSPALDIIVTAKSRRGFGNSYSPVRLLDSSGNLTGSNAVVTISIAGGPTGASLSGTTSVAAVSGIATFSNLILTKAGSKRTRPRGLGARPAPH